MPTQFESGKNFIPGQSSHSVANLVPVAGFMATTITPTMSSSFKPKPQAQKPRTGGKTYLKPPAQDFSRSSFSAKKTHVRDDWKHSSLK